MTVVGTDETLTVDANVVNYYFIFKSRKPLPQGLRVRRIKDFCFSILDKYPIAINQFIRTEYEQTIGLELTKSWLAKRLRANLAIDVKCISLSRSIKNRLRDDYGFDCNSMDVKYIETSVNTIFKRLVTENTDHFHRPHRSGRQRPMQNFLKRRLQLLVCRIDECCIEILGN